MVNVMKVVFWVSAACVFYTYAGYYLLLRIMAFFHPRPAHKATVTPSVSIVMAVHNEESLLPNKLINLRSLAYPPDRIQIVVVSDGSTDRTAMLLQRASDVTAVLLEEAVGKASALNAAVRNATGDLLVFFDVRQTVDHDALQELVSGFADDSVGAVSGELLLESSPGVPSGDALGIYWKIEKSMRKFESLSGSVVGATGAIYAVRRDLYRDLPEGTILDDVLTPMNVIRAGKRVLFEPGAIARDRIFSQPGKEFSRKIRTLTGNYQLVQLAPWLLSPNNPLLFRFISHKLFRLAVPLWLLLMLLTSAFAGGALYLSAFILQSLCYAAAGLAIVMPASRKMKLVRIAHTFLMLNAAALSAFYNFAAGRKKIWV
ncbi:Glycosyltransferase, catalytic subunit of cellulose synthase and poly-beta-1,6-N-acetylglucosamine synthase [Granulicella pectinivorans]|uniref:Glycosyltransferase, catalytic subunit of cellulose synthase and poly-beta-1,6-N-acetylglucosamine synthase n=1 Tax=Granulicella pectinivorans TaxID=474950 RepID=A0A1I6MMA2_9BACT|nr:glycosyltransferase family 2 protein [Granulicella pectinivorans]SFS16784.1 Glycosyltransferase, catalytic subunit of cellulose synthase and poly-beta-1,6-N-acetylglucosamine synthase [Granulicella pectinivorans]